MEDFLLAPRNKPRLTTTDKGNSPNSVRAYRSSPEGITVQIRLDGRIVSAALSFDEAKEFGAAILRAAGGDLQTAAVAVWRREGKLGSAR